MGENLLSKVNNSADVKALPKESLAPFCKEIREKIISTVSKNGGHLASNLGSVELTVALHRVFDSERDKFIFDVGHQSYTHKLLTGRGSMFDTLRTQSGISGFPKMCEGDAFGTGHSSTSVSAALGMSTAMKLQGKTDFAIAVIGDGALTGGIAYEGLNNAGKSGANLLVLLNENDMSISANVGAFASHLSRMAAGESYFNFKDNVKSVLKGTPIVGGALFKAADKIKEMSKHLIEVPDRNFFEDFGFEYFGVIDGHDIAAMETVFRRVKKLEKPCVVHVKTKKGKGYAFAEENPALYHGVSGFDVEKGIAEGKSESFSAAFTDKLCEIAEGDDRVCAITAAMTGGVALTEFAGKFPKRFFDVGIAEEHAAIFAAGLAAEGLKPVFLCYSSFLQRAYDQILHDVQLQKLPVIFGVDRAGLVGADGETHNGVFDVSMFGAFQNTQIYSPASYVQVQAALSHSMDFDGISVIRYPRGKQPDLPESLCEDKDIIDYDTENADAVIITYGRICKQALLAKQMLSESGIKAGIVLLVKIKPIDTEKLAEYTADIHNIVFAEEGVRNGGIGISLAENFSGKAYRVLAIDNPFVAHASEDAQLKMCGIDAEAIAKAVAENGR